MIKSPLKRSPSGPSPVLTGAAAALPPRERILASARELFYRHGVRAVGVDAIAEAAGTNKMTLYRHFPSKDELVAECLRQFGGEVDAAWVDLQAEHPGDPRAQLVSWLKRVADRLLDPQDRGCALINAAIELPEKDHPAREVVEVVKAKVRARITGLCVEAGLSEPEMLADELILLIEGARVCAQSMGPNGPCGRVVSMGEALIVAHEPHP